MIENSLVTNEEYVIKWRLCLNGVWSETQMLYFCNELNKTRSYLKRSSIFQVLEDINNSANIINDEEIYLIDQFIPRFSYLRINCFFNKKFRIEADNLSSVFWLPSSNFFEQYKLAVLTQDNDNLLKNYLKWDTNDLDVVYIGYNNLNIKIDENIEAVLYENNQNTVLFSIQITNIESKESYSVDK